MTEIWLAFLAGLAGSPHCVGMCGGIVTALALAGRDRSVSSGRLFQLGYNLGRITTYTAMGFAAGLLGSSFSLLAVRGVSLWFFAAANLFVFIIGIGSALNLSFVSIFALDGSGAHVFARPLRWALAGSNVLRAYPLGVVLGFLPCGLVYASLAIAAGTGSSLAGAAIMAALGLGTLPLLFAVGTTAVSLSSRLRGIFFRVTGIMVALMGGAGLWRVLGKMGYLPSFPF